MFALKRYLLARSVLARSVAACAAALCVAGGGAALAARATVPASGPWGTAIEVPGLAAVNTGGGAVYSVSCASAGNCAAGGGYNRHGHGLGFVAAERRGRWGTAITMPGPLDSVSCASAGNCVAGGHYFRANGQGFVLQGFVVVERDGRWGRAIRVPGLESLNTGGLAGVSSVSCGLAGDCVVGGTYLDRSHLSHGFVAAERNGRWGRAIEVPGLRALGVDADGLSVSCGSAGNCAVGGSYVAHGNRQGFVAGETSGRWGQATGVPGLGALNTGGNAGISSVSCGSAGNCAVGGWYTEGDGNNQGFVADERDGAWGTAIEVPGLGALNTGGNADVLSVSCGSAGNCVAGGTYARRGSGAGFVAVERDGAWGTAIEVPGLQALGGDAFVWSVSCAPAGSCAAGGWYDGRNGHLHGFVASETNGAWGRAIAVPGLAALNMGDAGVLAVSCVSAGNCTAGGYFSDRSHHHHQGFVTKAS